MPLGIHPSELAPTLLYVGGLVAFVVSATRYPQAGLYYIVPLLPLQTMRYKIHQFPLGAQWIDLMLLGVLIGLLRKRYPIITSSPLTKLLLFLAVLTYLSLWKGSFFLGFPLPIWFDDPRVSDWKNYMVIFETFFLTLASIREVKQMKILLLLMCFAILLINRDYINTMRGRDFSTFSYDVRDAGVMGYAGVNGLAALEAQVAAFLLGLCSFYRAGRAKAGYYYVVVGTSLLALVYTLSRGGYAAVLAAALFIGIVKNRKLLLVVLLFLFIWQDVVPTAVRERVFMTHGANGELDPSAGDRVTLWENAIEIIKSDPVLGTGFDTYKFMHAVGPYEDTHNYYVKVWLETGFIGLIIFLCILAKLFTAGFGLRNEQTSDGFLPGLGLGLASMVVACIVTNCFGDRWTYIEETGFLWVIAACAIRGRMLLSEPEMDSEPDEEEETLPATT